MHGAQTRGCARTMDGKLVLLYFTCVTIKAENEQLTPVKVFAAGTETLATWRTKLRELE